MNWTNDVFYVCVLTSVTGSIAYLVWRLIRVWMEKHKKLRFVYPILAGVLPFFLLPIVYFHLRIKCQYGLPGATNRGILFLRTPLIYEFQRVFTIVWIAGIVLNIVHYVNSACGLEKVIRKTCFVPDVRFLRWKARIEKELEITKKVNLYQSYSIHAPVVTGIFKKSIVLPVQRYEEDEIEAVMYHELVHIRQNIVDLKNIGLLIKMMHWINPCVYFLYRDLEEWSETACDLEVHYNTECGLTFQEYFKVILDGIESDDASFSELVTQFRKMKGVKGRIMRLKGYQRKRDLRFASGLLMAGIFCISCTTTALAAGNQFVEAYDSMYYGTVVEIEEEANGFQDGLIEQVDRFDETAQNVVEMGRQTRSAYIMDWSIPGKTTYCTPNYYVNKDKQISINVSVSPSGKKVKIGIVDPEGYRHYVESSGNISHSFAVEKSGAYVIFCENGNSSEVHVEGSFTY